ncbi:MAG: hypothetical protein P4L84_02380 [Isosphaeraceae bacterium]|nr:hypothetical protein [Isosphaeraceae bacterium]
MSEALPPIETVAQGHPALDGTVSDHVDGLQTDTSGEESVDQKLAEIEMAGEEVAAGWKPAPHQPLSPEVRYLHISRTIHQLITDRNRSVGIFLGVASLLFAASTALLNVKSDVVPIVPVPVLQYWCLPVTFGTLAILGLFISLLLIRARIGLIYEVTKMNTLLGLPSQRVERVNPLSIFYLMHLMVVVLGGASAGFTAGMLVFRANHVAGGVAAGLVVALVYTALLQALYYGTILRATTETKLQKARA